MTAITSGPDGSTLPHWDTIPTDVPAAIREIKIALRSHLETTSGRSVAEVFAEVEDRIRVEIDDIEATRRRGQQVWPVIDFADVEADTVSEGLVAAVRRRGCAVIRGHFPHEQARAWDRDVVDYVENNRFFENYTGPADDFFGTLEMSRPEIYPIYWSSAQMEARQSPRMAAVQSFLNARWTHESEGRVWFDPDRDSLYPDRIRRRPPGADSGGLGTHLDPGTLDLWMSSGYQRHFRHLFRGDVAAYDRGTPPTAPRPRSTPDRRCARPFGRSRAGPPCATWTTTRACCTRCRSRARWPT